MGRIEYFDIEANTEGDPGASQKRLMLQSLLADRFQIALHHETRQSPVFALVVAKPGKMGPQLARMRMIRRVMRFLTQNRVHCKEARSQLTHLLALPR